MNIRCIGIRPFWLGLTFYQGVALALIAALAVQWFFDRRLAAREIVSVPDGVLEKA